MTTTYDPFHPAYFDETDLRHELDRVYDLCHGCRLCFKFCPSFPTLFDYVDAIPGQDASEMTPAQQDHVVDQCFNCKLCHVNCPYTPGQHEWELDFPRLMLRAEQILRRNRARPVSVRLTDRALASTDLVGHVGAALAPLVNKALGTPGSRIRTAVEKTVGVARQRVVAPYSKQRFSTWFNGRRPALGRDKQATVAMFPTCIVEYQDVGVGHDLVKVYERNGIECTLPDGQVCCGAPALHQGDVDRFAEQARRNIKVLSGAVRAAEAAGEHLEIVVPQPTCGYVLKFDYLDYVGGPDAQLVAERTKDAAEYLVGMHKHDDGELDTTFAGEVPATTTYHAPCHLRAQNIGLKSRDLMKLTGSSIKVVAECSGIDGTWGLRAQNMDAARAVATKMVVAIEKADGELVTGDCSLANGGIVLETGRAPLHPLQMVARAYGIPHEPNTPRGERPRG